MNGASNSDRDDWEGLQNEWQAYQPDIKLLKKKITWVSWRMKILLFASVLLVLCYAIYIGFLFTRETSLALKIWHSLVFPITLYVVYWDFKLRLPLLSLESESTKDIIDFYFRRVKAGIKVGEFGLKVCFVFLLFYTTWIAIGFYFDLFVPELQRTGFIIFGFIWIVGFALGMMWYRNKKRKELATLNHLWRDYLD